MKKQSRLQESKKKIENRENTGKPVCIKLSAGKSIHPCFTNYLYYGHSKE